MNGSRITIINGHMSRWEMFLLCFLIRFPIITKKQKTLFLSGTKNGEVYSKPTNFLIILVE
jgi:hypothetical protein